MANNDVDPFTVELPVIPPLEGAPKVAVNDVGGMAVPGGRIRTGLLFRLSGGMAGAADLRRLEEVALRMVVDFRGGDEDRSQLEGWAREKCVEYRHEPIPVGGADQVAEMLKHSRTVDGAAEQLRLVYGQIVDLYGDRIARTVNALADILPAGFGCAAGKDRTGVVAALVQSFLGADPSDIARDYVACAPGVERVKEFLASKFGLDKNALGYPGLEVLLGANEATILAILDRVGCEYGSVTEFFQRFGVSAESLRRLRTCLIAP